MAEKTKIAEAAASASEVAPESMVHKLRKPYSYNGIYLTELRFREPMIMDMFDLGDMSDSRTICTMISRLTGVNIEDVQRLPFYELGEISTKLAPFLRGEYV